MPFGWGCFDGSGWDNVKRIRRSTRIWVGRGGVDLGLDGVLREGGAAEADKTREGAEVGRWRLWRGAVPRPGFVEQAGDGECGWMGWMGWMMGVHTR